MAAITFKKFIKSLLILILCLITYKSPNAYQILWRSIFTPFTSTRCFDWIRDAKKYRTCMCMYVCMCKKYLFYILLDKDA